MILIIDTTKREVIRLGLFCDQKPKFFEFDTADQSADLLPVVEGTLKKNKLSLQDIKKILVNQGPGSFTGVRVGVTVANTLAWTLDIPVLGYKDGELDETLIKIKKTKNLKFEKIVLPYYPAK